MLKASTAVTVKLTLLPAVIVVGEATTVKPAVGPGVTVTSALPVMLAVTVSVLARARACCGKAFVGRTE